MLLNTTTNFLCISGFDRSARSKSRLDRETASSSLIKTAKQDSAISTLLNSIRGSGLIKRRKLQEAYHGIVLAYQVHPEAVDQ
jgi:hypothetical protein